MSEDTLQKVTRGFMRGLQLGQHKARVKEYADTNRHVLKCFVCGIEVGFDPEKRAGLDRTKLLFGKLPCLASNATAGLHPPGDRSDNNQEVLPESGLAHVTSHFGLSPRESQVLRLVLRGLASKEIASEMKLSPNTVKAFIRMLMIKMAVSTRARIVVKALNCANASQESSVRQSDERDFVQAPHLVSTTTRAPAIVGRLRSTAVQIDHRDAAPPLIDDSENEKKEAAGQEPSRDALVPRLPESSETPDGSEEPWRDRFTPKERRILALLVQGSTCKEIAAQLDASEKTVRNYLRALISTTGSSDLSELTEFTLAHRVLEETARNIESR